jgi:small GTP-binding protein
MKENKVFLFGLDNAGKTSVAHYIKTGGFIDNPKPTKSFDISAIFLQDLDFRVWDAPGQKFFRDKWGKGLDSANMMVFVLDTADNNRFAEAKEELYNVINNMDTLNVPLIFCFHKADLVEHDVNFKDAMVFFGIDSIMDRKVYTLVTSVRTEKGLQRLKDLLVELVQKARF